MRKTSEKQFCRLLLAIVVTLSIALGYANASVEKITSEKSTSENSAVLTIIGQEGFTEFARNQQKATNVLITEETVSGRPPNQEVATIINPALNRSIEEKGSQEVRPVLKFPNSAPIVLSAASLPPPTTMEVILKSQLPAMTIEVDAVGLISSAVANTSSILTISSQIPAQSLEVTSAGVLATLVTLQPICPGANSPPIEGIAFSANSAGQERHRITNDAVGKVFTS